MSILHLFGFSSSLIFDSDLGVPPVCWVSVEFFRVRVANTISNSSTEFVALPICMRFLISLNRNSITSEYKKSNRESSPKFQQRFTLLLQRVCPLRHRGSLKTSDDSKHKNVKSVVPKTNTRKSKNRFRFSDKPRVLIINDKSHS